MDRILRDYLQVSQQLSQLFRRHFGKVSLTFPQALTLSVLGREGPMPISKLAEKTGGANSTISGIMDRLERLGFARRVRSEQDRRVIYVEVTEQYQNLKEEAKTGVGEYFENILSTLSAEEREQIAHSLELFERALDRAGEQDGRERGKE